MGRKRLEESSSSDDSSSDEEFVPETKTGRGRGRKILVKKTAKNEEVQRKIVTAKRTRSSRRLKVDDDDSDVDDVSSGAAEKGAVMRDVKNEPSSRVGSDRLFTGMSTHSVDSVRQSSRKPFNVIHSLINTSLNLRFKSLALNQSYDYCLNNVTKVLLPNLVSIPVSMNKIGSPRIMSLAWHPTDSNVLIVGGKHGDMYHISDFEFAIPAEEKLPSATNYQLLDSVGPAGGLTQIKFDPNNQDRLYTTSIAGIVARLDLVTKDHLSIFQVEDPRGDHLDHWFTALDVDEDKNRVQVGDNKGYFHFMPKNLEGSKKCSFSSHKLHKNKITCIDHYPKQPNLVATCSTDSTVKIWDLRLVKEEKPIKMMLFEGPVEAGFFSKTNGGTFVTSDQRHRITKFCTSSWSQELMIQHPQDTFQHLTPIKGSWHPTTDVFAIPRYNIKDKSDGNGRIDFWNMKSGEHVFSLEDPKYNGIKSGD